MGTIPELTTPMRMSRLVLSRMALLSLAVFAIGAALVAWQAQRDVQQEARSAHAVARALDIVARLPAMAAPERERALAALQAIAGSGELRHLRIRIRDAGGRDLLASPAAPSVSTAQAWLFAALARLLPDRRQPPVSWDVPLRDGGRYTVVLAVDPSSEQHEAMVGILDVLTILAIFGALMLAAAALSLRQALKPLRGILAAIDGYRAQRYDQRAPVAGTHEMNAISGALNHLARELADAQQQRAALSGRLLTLQEDERAHLARELHDEFGQTLTAMRADAAWLAQRLREQPELHAVALELRAHCDQASGDIRHLLERLRPRGAETGRVPLRRMLAQLVAGWQSRRGIDQRFQLRHDLDDDALPESLSLALYRISQEALTNAARHSNARQVVLTLRVDEEGALLWEARDDGDGLPAGGVDDGVGNGLVGIRERVWAHGGDLEIGMADAEAHRGLALRARFPAGRWRADAPAAG